MFEVGDKVKCIDIGDKGFGWKLGFEFVIGKIDRYPGTNDVLWHQETNSYGIYANSVELITNNKTIMENVKEKFLALFIKEPEKTFRKAGITNGDGFLTEEGQSVFLGYLLNKHGVDFKKEVVDEIVKEEKGDK